MAFTTLSLGLTLTLPTPGTKSWGQTMLSTTWTKISQHAHTGTGDGNQMVTASYSNNSITTPKLALNIGTNQAASTNAPSGTTQTIDWNQGNNQKLDLTGASGDVTLTLNNPVTGGLYRLFVTQAATPRNLIWPANVKWPQGQAPLLSQAAGNIDGIELYFDGTNYYGGWNLTFS